MPLINGIRLEDIDNDGNAPANLTKALRLLLADQVDRTGDYDLFSTRVTHDGEVDYRWNGQETSFCMSFQSSDRTLRVDVTEGDTPHAEALALIEEVCPKRAVEALRARLELLRQESRDISKAARGEATGEGEGEANPNTCTDDELTLLDAWGASGLPIAEAIARLQVPPANPGRTDRDPAKPKGEDRAEVRGQPTVAERRSEGAHFEWDVLLDPATGPSRQRGLKLEVHAMPVAHWEYYKTRGRFAYDKAVHAENGWVFVAHLDYDGRIWDDERPDEVNRAILEPVRNDLLSWLEARPGVDCVAMLTNVGGATQFEVDLEGDGSNPAFKVLLQGERS
jgi:hypothetical protein